MEECFEEKEKNNFENWSGVGHQDEQRHRNRAVGKHGACSEKANIWGYLRLQ